ncbi:MAG: endolytic transglycosylase MltG [Cryobacterium sp.]|nr:endolytic transglycosylase MltG [Oligoflexia bacterium]
MRSQPSENGSFKVTVAVSVLLLIALVFSGLGFFFRTALQAYQPANTTRVIIEIPKGKSPPAIARQLEAMQVIRNHTIFLYYGKLKGSWARAKAGEYELSPSMSPSQILAILESGLSVSHPFLIREGENSYEVAADIEAKGFGPKEKFLKLSRDASFISSLGLLPPPKSLEGYLFPDTYMLQRKMSQEDILRAMVKRFQAAWGANEEQRARELGLTRDQVITLASIVEKETGAPEERPIISGVFHNRLRKKMRLQSDPTSIYGIWSRYRGKIHRSDLMEMNPYNTYMIPGLPVGPISNPGNTAMQATLNPAEHHYLYFVSQNNGTHIFTATYEEHSRAVTKFQLDPKAREGKSWRDLKSRSVLPSPLPNLASPLKKSPTRSR